MSKPKGFMYPPSFGRAVSHEKPCKCRRCGAKWAEVFPGPMLTNGVKTYDYCSECDEPETCPSCGEAEYVIARDMKATRFCGCGESWEPKK